MPPLHDLSILQAADALRSGTTTSLALTEHALARMAALDGKLNAFVLELRESALESAVAADADLKAGRDRGPLHGIPYGLKDIYDTAGIRTTCHSKLRLDVVPKDDSVVAAKLKAAGGILLGKLATHEFAIGGPSSDLPFPPARNPWSLDRIPGGSSSGSAAAVAAGFCRMAMGSDTGGSIRGPAAYCGLVGLKPTYGLVSRRGVFPLSYTLDHCGPLTWSVEDAAVTMELISGHDPHDPASAPVAKPHFRRELGWGVHGLRIAIPANFFAASAGADISAAMQRVSELLQRAGAIVETVALPDYALFSAAGRTILNAEAYAIHEHDLKTRPHDYARRTYFRLMAGAFTSAADVVQALRIRRRLTELLNRDVLTRYDALLTPTSLTTAPAFAEVDGDVPPTMPVQTIPWNLTGSPVAAVPAGFARDGLPLSVQVVGRPFEDPLTLRIAAVIEAALDTTSKRPQFAATA